MALVARDLQDPAGSLPLVGPALPVPVGHMAIYVSEPMVDLYGARPGSVFTLLSKPFSALALSGRAQAAIAFIASFEGLKPSLLNFVTAVTVKNASTA